MDEKQIAELQKNMEKKDTMELLNIWRMNARGMYTDEAFEAIKRVLTNRSVDIPQQEAYTPDLTYDGSFVLRHPETGKEKVIYRYTWQNCLVCGPLYFFYHGVIRYGISLLLADVLCLFIFGGLLIIPHGWGASIAKRTVIENYLQKGYEIVERFPGRKRPTRKSPNK